MVSESEDEATVIGMSLEDVCSFAVRLLNGAARKEESHFKLSIEYVSGRPPELRWRRMGPGEEEISINCSEKEKYKWTEEQKKKQSERMSQIWQDRRVKLSQSDD